MGYILINFKSVFLRLLLGIVFVKKLTEFYFRKVLLDENSNFKMRNQHYLKNFNHLIFQLLLVCFLRSRIMKNIFV